MPDKLIDAFADAMRRKLNIKSREGWTGWRDSDFTEEVIVGRIKEQIEKKTIDPVDIGNYAAFLFYKQRKRVSRPLR